MSIVKVDTQLSRMLRDIDMVCSSHASLAKGLFYWQWQLFGRWHFGEGKDRRFNPFWLREDALAQPSGDKWRACPRGIMNGAIRETVCSYRGFLPPQIVEIMLTRGKREAEVLLVLYASQPEGIWHEPASVSPAPVAKKQNHHKPKSPVRHTS